jgi:uncharacterized protein (TIGR03437 family)
MNFSWSLFKLAGASAFAVFAIASSIVTTRGQNTSEWQWQNLTPSSGQTPAPRRDGETIYDPINRRIILFGGNSNNGPLNDIWEFDLGGKTWARLETKGAAPAPRFGFDAVYDPVGRQMVIYSGQGAGFFNDTWTLNLTTLEWKEVSPAAENERPKKRYGSGAVFDPLARSLVSFAGFTSEAGRFQDTQSFGLTTHTWTDWTPAGNKPQVRCLLTAALDPVGQRMIIYGGQRNGPLDDIWAFDLAARQWANLTPADRPAGRMFASSFVNKDGHFMLFGGSGNGNYNETWEFDLNILSWKQLQIGNPPPARNAAMSVYIESEDRFILFGGTGNSGNLNDVWELSRVSAMLRTVSAASFDGTLLAPESIASAFGSNLAMTSQSAITTPLPISIAGTSVRIKDGANIDHSAKLFFVSPMQVNYLIPAGIAPGPATVTLTSGDGSTAAGMVQIANVAPGLFSANADGRGVAAAYILRAPNNSSQVSEPISVWDAELNRFIAKPIDLRAVGEQVYLVLFGTGIRYHSGLSSLTVQIGGLNTMVLYAGPQNGYTGLDQVNLLLPPQLAGRGEVDVVLTADGRTTNTVRVSFK